MTLLGITKRTNDGKPFIISQIANSNMPTDILTPPFLFKLGSFLPPDPYNHKERNAT